MEIGKTWYRCLDFLDGVSHKIRLVAQPIKNVRETPETRTIAKKKSFDR